MNDIIDQEVKEFLDSLGKSQDAFIADIEELKDEGLSAEEIMAILGAIIMVDYLLVDLAMESAIAGYLANIDNLLDDLFMFGRITESQLLALRSVQEASIVAYTQQLGEQMRLSLIEGVSSNLSKSELKNLLGRNLNLSPGRIETVVSTSMATYRRSITATMSEGLSEETLFWYEGPLDHKTRPICRVMLAAGPLQRGDIDSSFPGAFLDGGGYNCRHEWLPLSSSPERVKRSSAAKTEIDAYKEKKGRSYRPPVTLQQYYESA